MAQGSSPRWRAYVAVGDSFTEGLVDPGPDGTFRGWADRLAERLATAVPDFRYANLAVRGKLLGQVIVEQLPVAERMRPDLVTFCAGGNDILRPGCDPDGLATVFEDATARLRATGAEVVLFTGFDPHQVPVLRRVRGKVATYNAHLHAIAERQGCRLVDLWTMTVLFDHRAWGEDRLHLTAEGHRRVALHTCEVLGVPVEDDWRAPWPQESAPPWVELRREDLRWTRDHLLPWVGRRLRRRSGGDHRGPKRPDLLPLP